MTAARRQLAEEIRARPRVIVLLLQVFFYASAGTMESTLRQRSCSTLSRPVSSGTVRPALTRLAIR